MHLFYTEQSLLINIQPIFCHPSKGLRKKSTLSDGTTEYITPCYEHNDRGQKYVDNACQKSFSSQIQHRIT